jgi:4-hydroxy-tetrahydrodipicolinate reductase
MRTSFADALMSPSIPVAVHGASGRMGQAIARVIAECAELRLVAALVRADSALAMQPIDPPLCRTTELAREVSPTVLIDFSEAAAFDRALALALERNIAFVSGTTGLDAAQHAALDRASASIPVLWSANFSLGVALLSRLVAEAARALPQWDCEIAEAHHSRKQDAPSGTALALGREVAAARGQVFDAVAKLSRSDMQAPRESGEIGFAVTRAGDIVGEHTVLFATAGERIELSHRATDRTIFARGAVAAARWIASRRAGRYALTDVLVNPAGDAKPEA